MILKPWGRKFFVFIITIAIYIVTSYIMTYTFWAIFIDKVFWMALSFMGSNAIEHISGALKNEK